MDTFSDSRCSGSGPAACTDLRGALTTVPKSHFAATTKPKQASELMRSIFGHIGHPSTVLALKPTPWCFARSGELRVAEWVKIDLDAAGLAHTCQQNQNQNQNQN